MEPQLLYVDEGTVTVGGDVSSNNDGIAVREGGKAYIAGTITANNKAAKPAKITCLKLKASKKKMTISWKKVKIK